MYPRITGQTAFCGHWACKHRRECSVDSAAGLRAVRLRDLLQAIDWSF